MPKGGAAKLPGCFAALSMAQQEAALDAAPASVVSPAPSKPIPPRRRQLAVVQSAHRPTPHILRWPVVLAQAAEYRAAPGVQGLARPACIGSGISFRKLPPCNFGQIRKLCAFYETQLAGRRVAPLPAASPRPPANTRPCRKLVHDTGACCTFAFWALCTGSYTSRTGKRHLFDFSREVIPAALRAAVQ